MPLCVETIKAFQEGAPIVTEFVRKLADTVLWSSIGAAVLGLILKLIQSVQHHHREHKTTRVH
jgi:hypothetical protein